MSKKSVENYIPQVMQIVQNKFPDGIAPKEFNGYISSFGASISQSGLQATVALFENKQADTAQERSCLTKIILEVLKSKEENLLQHILNYNGNQALLKMNIIDIAIALKLSLRTFKLEKGLEDVRC